MVIEYGHRYILARDCTDVERALDLRDGQ
jgi:hypothetical protein